MGQKEEKNGVFDNNQKALDKIQKMFSKYNDLQGAVFNAGFEKFLDRSKLKQVDICKELGVSSPVVSSWKNGLKIPDWYYLGRLYELGMTPLEIFGFNSKDTQNKLDLIEALTKENQELKQQLEAYKKSGASIEKIALVLEDVLKRVDALEKK